MCNCVGLEDDTVDKFKNVYLDYYLLTVQNSDDDKKPT